MARSLANAVGFGPVVHAVRVRMLLLTALSTAVPHGAALADTVADTVNEQPGGLPGGQPDPTTREIVVTAPFLFQDVLPERDLDSDAVLNYGVSTVDELVDQLQGELGSDDEPIFLVNGERVYDLAAISAYPVEVVKRVQVLPRGEGVAVGGAADQRVVSFTFHDRLRSATMLAAPGLATEGGWASARGEAAATYVKGSTRANIAARVRGEDMLLESRRGIVQPRPVVPYAIGGNIVSYPFPGGEIDPQLSALVGREVTVAAVPLATMPMLQDIAARAGQPAMTDLGPFRTLRPEARNYEVNANFATRLAPWLTLNSNARLNRTDTMSLLGLQGVLIGVGPENSFSPFDTAIGIATYAQQSPLMSSLRLLSGEAGLTLTATIGRRWQVVFNARYFETETLVRTDEGATSPGLVADSINPFGLAVGPFVPGLVNTANSTLKSGTVTLSAIGRLVDLPAGAVQTTFEGRFDRNTISSSSTFLSANDSQSFERNEVYARAAVQVPLTSTRNNFLGDVGDISATADFRVSNFTDAGTLKSHSLGLNWDPVKFLRFRASVSRAETPAGVALLASPVVVTPMVRTLDILSGQTIDVTRISGGNPFLLPSVLNVKRLSGTLRLLPSAGLDLTGEYVFTDDRNIFSNINEQTLGFVTAFPDRFVRDTNGRLVTVDVRPVNFSYRQEKRLRYGVNLNVPLGGGAAGAPAQGAMDDGGQRRASMPMTRLQMTANHSVIFKDEILVRPDMDAVDLLDGGLTGLGGGRPRHQVDFSGAIASGGTGIRMGGIWRGGSRLATRVDGAPELLWFAPLMTVNMNAFLDAQRVLPGRDWARQLRLSLNVVNLTGQRQRVRDSAGATPLQFQPAYRDPVGRQVEVEFRKVF